jgi:polysaccharide chain length determinant protein (PEP-CTERM system associated)
MSDSLPGIIGLMLREGKRRLLPLSVVFAVIALLVLGIGLVMPKKWDAQMTIIVETDDVIKPLMEGRAPMSKPSTQMALVMQVVLGHKVLRQIAFDAGLMPERTTPQDQEKLLNNLRTRIKIDNKTDEIVRITYSDSDARRAARITNLIGKTFIDESATLKASESREAFNFIDNRVKEYGEKLGDAHKKLLDYYRSESTTHPAGKGVVAAAAPTPGDDVPPAPRPIVPAGARLSAEELASLRLEAATLEAQLGKKSQADIIQDTKNEDQARQHVATAQSELDRLRATFTDEHPDVRKATRDLAVAKAELQRAEEARNETAKAQAATARLDDEVAQAARTRLVEVQAKIAAATGHRMPRSSMAVLATRAVTEEAADRDPEMRGVGLDAKQSELFRVYDSTREVYQDLLKRRENARVAMDLDAEHRGFTMRVQEEAEVPASASSLRLMHIAIIGLVLAVLIPFGLLFAIMKFDRRVRTPQQIERLAHVPLLVSIPYEPGRYPSLSRGRYLKVALLIGGVFLVYGTTFIIKILT